MIEGFVCIDQSVTQRLENSHCQKQLINWRRQETNREADYLNERPEQI